MEELEDKLEEKLEKMEEKMRKKVKKLKFGKTSNHTEYKHRKSDIEQRLIYTVFGVKIVYRPFWARGQPKSRETLEPFAD